MNDKAKVKIDFVSDVSCPWCIIGLKSLEKAVANLGGEVEADIHFQPFELNPQMPPEAIRRRGEDVGFKFSMDKRGRIYNTFDAHRLLHWAEIEGRQLALKEALFKAYFTDGENPGDHGVLVRLANEVGLDAARAKEILSSNEYADAVRERERFYQGHGINAVPAVIINDRHLIQGGQPAEVFEKALREIAGAA
jgi:predicted DsbA family dithiol-disulfide isomerase